ncbi:MAG TPA: Ig-like domain-containing protein [Gemmatimonadales bacterium]|nr:Ig-like domain-containing protein [Gemmatimonadales bacterium]
MRTQRRLALPLLSLLILACRDASGPDAGENRTIARVLVSPTSATLEPGTRLQLTAEARDDRDQSVTDVTFSWSSSAPAAAVSEAGVVSGVAAGSAAITATASGVSGTSEITVRSPPPPPGSVVLLAAGDIAQCGSSDDEATAALLDGAAGTVAVLGDNAYENGTLADYTECYGPSWGRHKERTKPSAGNHEYHTPGAAGYYDYFGTAAGDHDKGYYSYDLGEWHVVVLNSNCAIVSCAPGSPQERWLRADLVAHPATCTVAYWHHPRFNSGASHGDYTAVAPLWQALYDAGAELILNGHEHLYERFAPQTTAAVADPARGIRQFTVGTGGRELHNVGMRKPNSEVLNDQTFGVLKLTLNATGYSWEFMPVEGSSFTDKGTGSCH